MTILLTAAYQSYNGQVSSDISRFRFNSYELSLSTRWKKNEDDYFRSVTHSFRRYSRNQLFEMDVQRTDSSNELRIDDVGIYYPFKKSRDHKNSFVLPFTGNVLLFVSCQTEKPSQCFSPEAWK